MPNPSGKYSTRTLTRLLKEHAMEVETITDDGDPVTRAEALSALLWKKALGYTKTVVDEDGVETEEVYLPENWAIQYIFERLDGKAGSESIDASDKPTAADRVRELAAARFNEEANRLVDQGPPERKPADG